MDRKLAAILAADVVGYSTLMERDEAGTFERLRAGRKELVEPTIAFHHGHVFKLMGDGLLAEFQSVIDAVECAVSLQRGLAERNASVPEDERIQVRIGINLGEVIVENDDRYGDGVNVAARLQHLAAPGGICVSGKVAKEVEKRLPFRFEPMGEQRVKNLSEPVPTYRIVLDPASRRRPAANYRNLRSRAWIGAVAALSLIVLAAATAWWRPWTPAEPPAAAVADTRPSLVVLPFENLSDDKQQEYLANGFTEDLTTELARVPGLFVVSRNAAFVYKGKETKPTQIASELGVRYLLEGSLRRVGDDMRINAQLIDGSTTGHIWAERFDGQWADVFSLQDRVVGSIAGALKLRLLSGPRAARAGGTNNAEAYDAYLKALDIYNRVNTPQEFAQAERYLQQAVKIDPDFGAAHARLAWAYWDANTTRAVVMGLTMDEAFVRLHQSLAKAALHPSTTYYQIVAELLLRAHNSDEAVSVLLKSVALDPSDAWNYLCLTNALNFNGRPREALNNLDAAARVDPHSWDDYRRYQVGLAEFTQGNFTDAARSIEEMALDAPDPWNTFYALQVLVSAYGHLGRADQAKVALDRYRKLLAQMTLGEPDLLITQDFMVFRDALDIERLLAGLRKAGIPDLPGIAISGLDPANRLSGPQIRSLLFGHDMRGKLVLPRFSPVRITISADGALTQTIGVATDQGKTWIQGDFICRVLSAGLTSCGAVFRNSLRTPGQQDEYKIVFRWEHIEFSVVD